MGNRCMRLAYDVDDLQPDHVARSVDFEEVAVDWSDENSVHHRSAINSLHNYALGKMGHLKEEDSGSIRTTSSLQRNGLILWQSISRTSTAGSRPRSLSISFASDLHQTFHFEAYPTSMESESTSANRVGSAHSLDHQEGDDRYRPALVCPTASACKLDGTTREANCLPVLPRFPCAEDDAPLNSAHLLPIE